jgi:ABC-type Zn uptake system ZnuABC Zn-binding protein ZnuA
VNVIHYTHPLLLSLRALFALLLAIGCLPAMSSQQASDGGKDNAAPLRVVCTLPDFGSIAKSIGGDLVAVDTLVRGAEDPHFTVTRPSLVRILAKAEMLVVAGLDLESAWLQPLCDNARNAAILRTPTGNLGVGNTGTGYAAGGYVDVSTVIVLRGLLADRVDRSLGDVHRGGNPHYMTDPLCGLQAAKLLCERFALARPAGKATFESNLAAFRAKLCVAMVGEQIAKAYEHDAETLAQLYELDRLDALLDKNGDRDKLAGWFGLVRAHRGARLVADHDLWPYFASRFGFVVRGFLEPRAGVAPTQNHLQEIVAQMRQEGISVVLSTPYFSPQHAAFVSRATDARIAEVAHQVGARDGAGDYIAMVDHNVRVVVAALENKQ